MNKSGVGRGVAVAVLLAVLSGVAHGAGVGLVVKGDIKKDRTSDKKEDKNSSTKTSTETAVYAISIQVSNTSKQEGEFDVEWYFIKRPVEGDGAKGDPVVGEKGKTTLSIGPQKRTMHQVESRPLTCTETKTATSGKSGGTKSSSSGDIFDGYIVLVKHDGEILAKQSNQARYLTEEWLSKLGN